ncbi:MULTISPECIES: citramalate synthase [Anaerotruncus]|jgi:2-isopropylmalate synthase|uniref:citramalate synthase n=1 Tax=Anaerotruncus TaxID=244127 RepID=UPI000832DDDD|nr:MULTISPECIES: citramalate synthase [Anaerotruncus]RGX55994.1 citramalate synthase [Anaerotruncus sp. AF02-27]
MKRIEIFDSTLRDGAQGESVSYSVEDKLNIVRSLDKLGIDYIEAGNPFSNPKDAEFFERVKGISLSHARIVAFGSTRRRGVPVTEDKNCAALLRAGTGCVSVFGKSSDWQVREVLGTTPEENLRMIFDTVDFFVRAGKRVFFDGEHFFDGYKQNPYYAVETLEAAEKAGACKLVLCDTNGGCFPDEIAAVTAEMEKRFPGKIGIHCHNDTGCAVAATIAAVKAGADHVQGTYIGIGERCGNANLAAAIANLQLKLGYLCIPPDRVSRLTKTARYISEVSNVRLPHSMPYVGKSAFAHKGGMHVDGVMKNSAAFEHINPESVGNRRQILLSEVSGRTALMSKVAEFVPNLRKDSPELQKLVDKLKALEYEGYQFEAATASFEMVVLKELGYFKPFFELELFRIIGEQDAADRHMASAMVKLRVGDRYEITADEGDGPVHALDRALRKALEVFYPGLSGVRLIDYKVRVMDTGKATAALVRVLIETSDGENIWTTVGVSTDIINASIHALVDSMEYKLYRDSMANNE